MVSRMTHGPGSGAFAFVRASTRASVCYAAPAHTAQIALPCVVAVIGGPVRRKGQLGAYLPPDEDSAAPCFRIAIRSG